ncbi:membrane-associated progesterone receptor component 2 [Trichogramma pretiosum]|uniref:membrane-associated progesterone receptor component 2 n=1 Tax=Trichogramma pretiosum TaxID=7493 RepID=UPI0006C9C4F5|nr:membrane-associated progesterone receptor component 2 [Trichogramma pretiosum]XP_014232224.1 membrane-associated progesterone receptor component 2 [Trichogramma pretiosum]
MAEADKSSPGAADAAAALTLSEYLVAFVLEIVRSPVNIGLVAVIVLLVYKIFFSSHKNQEAAAPIKQLPKLRRDFTVEELRPYNGTGPDGRILVAVNGNVYDVTKGARFYGPGGPYGAFGGRDASRGLATFSVVPGKDEYDDLSDLQTEEMNSVKEWEEQFKERYDLVGKLLKPGEPHTNYSDEEEEEGSQQDNEPKSKNE